MTLSANHPKRVLYREGSRRGVFSPLFLLFVSISIALLAPDSAYSASAKPEPTRAVRVTMKARWDSTGKKRNFLECHNRNRKSVRIEASAKSDGRKKFSIFDVNGQTIRSRDVTDLFASVRSPQGSIIIRQLPTKIYNNKTVRKAFEQVSCRLRTAIIGSNGNPIFVDDDTPTPTPSATPTLSPTPEPTAVAPSETPTAAPTTPAEPTPSQAPTPSDAPTPTPIATISATPTPPATPTPGATDSVSPSPSVSPTASSSPSPTQTGECLQISSENERSSLNPTTRKITSTADIVVRNNCPTHLTAPFDCIFNLSAGGVDMPGSFGGPTVAPYNKYYFTVPGADGQFNVNGIHTFAATFVRNVSVPLSYNVQCLRPGEEPTPSPSSSPTASPTLSPTASPTISPSPSPAASATGSPTPIATISPSRSPTPVPTATGTPAPTPVTTEPEITVTPLSFVINEGEEGTVDVTGFNPGGGFVSLTGSPKVDNALFQTTPGITAIGQLVFHPDFSQSGIYTFEFTVTNESGIQKSLTAQITVLDIDRNGQLSAPLTQTVAEGQLLRFKIQATDPDGPTPTVEANNVPANGVFVPGTGTFLFAPDYDQSGSYDVDFSTVDDTKTTHIVVTDVDPGTGGGVAPLILNVDPVQSPVLTPTARITGAVNQNSQGPVAPQVVSALITGVNPATIQQGKTASITLTGETAGKFATAFAQDSSILELGTGLTVDSLTVNSASQIVATVSAAPNAPLGPTDVTVRTGSQVAVSVVALNIVSGTTVVKGKLVNPQTGQPIAGAKISILGSNGFVITDLNGEFILNNAPFGVQKLVVNAPNFQFLQIPVDLAANQVYDIGTVESKPTVFNPADPSSATLLSVVGRGVGDPLGNTSIDDAKKLIVDTFLALGGTEAGVIDEYGNQLNPKVTGEGVVSMSPELVTDIAEDMARGETTSLGDLILAFSFSVKWTNGAPLRAAEWIYSIQQAVNFAWANPDAPNSASVIATFTQSRSLSQGAPIISVETKLTPLQRQLFTLSFLAYAVEYSQTYPDQFASLDRSLFDRLESFLIADAYAQTLPTPVPGGDVFTAYHANMYGSWGNFPGSLVAGSASPGFSAGLNMLAPNLFPAGSNPSTFGSGNFAGMIFGTLRTLLVNNIVEMILETKVPQPPVPVRSEQVLLIYLDGTTGPGKGVRVEFSTSGSDRTLDNLPNVVFQYRLWRFKTVNSAPELVEAAVPNYQDLSKSELETIPLGGKSFRLAFTDTNPRKGTNIYRVDCARFVGPNSGENGTNNLGQSSVDWRLGALPQPSFTIAGRLSGVLGGFNPVGTLLAFLDPFTQIINGIKAMVSAMSPPVIVFFGDTPLGVVADTIAPNPKQRWQIFEGVSSRGEVHVYDTLTQSRSFLLNTGFAGSVHSGLAVNSAGQLFAENPGTDASWGGKIFRYDLIGIESIPSYSGYRSHVGMMNYYSFLLGYAHPTAVGGLASAADGDIFAIDLVSNQIKKVPVSATYDPFRRVGQPYAESPLFQFAPGTPMIAYGDNTLAVATADNVLLVDENRNVSKIFPDTNPFGGARGMAWDDQKNLLLSFPGQSPTDGSIVSIPLRYQRPDIGVDACKARQFTVVEGINDVGGVHPDYLHGEAIFYQSQGEIRREQYGITGTVLDSFLQPISGATVIVEREGLQVGKPVRTGTCGEFIMTGMKDWLETPFVSVTIKSGSISKTFSTMIEKKGQTFRAFVLDTFTLATPAPSPVPTPAGPSPSPTPGATPTPTPQPKVQVSISAGKTVQAPKLYVNVEPLTDPTPGPSAVPSATPVLVSDEPKVKIEIVSPVPGSEIDDQQAQELLIQVASTLPEDFDVDILVNGVKKPVTKTSQGGGLFKLSGLLQIDEIAGGIFKKGGALDITSNIFAALDPLKKLLGSDTAGLIGAITKSLDPLGNETQVVKKASTGGLFGSIGKMVSGVIVPEGIGSIVSGALVKIQPKGGLLDSFKAITTFTDSFGIYKVPQLPPGDYEISVETAQSMTELLSQPTPAPTAAPTPAPTPGGP